MCTQNLCKPVPILGGGSVTMIDTCSKEMTILKIQAKQIEEQTFTCVNI